MPHAIHFLPFISRALAECFDNPLDLINGRSLNWIAPGSALLRRGSVVGFSVIGLGCDVGDVVVTLLDPKLLIVSEEIVGVDMLVGIHWSLPDSMRGYVRGWSSEPRAMMRESSKRQIAHKPLLRVRRHGLLVIQCLMVRRRVASKNNWRRIEVRVGVIGDISGVS